MTFHQVLNSDDERVFEYLPILVAIKIKISERESFQYLSRQKKTTSCVAHIHDAYAICAINYQQSFGFAGSVLTLNHLCTNTSLPHLETWKSSLKLFIRRFQILFFIVPGTANEIRTV